MITVLLVDDNALFRESLHSMLAVAEDIQVVASASSGMEALDHASLSCPDITVMDISMPVMDGIEAAREMRSRCRSTRVMMLSIFDQPEYIQRALDVGAVGYVLKDRVFQDLLAAIRALYQGGQYFSNGIASIAQHYRKQDGNLPEM
ncbi:MAG TPA: response regulator transcription factor [Anaerolineales bacterium]|nr:response regulator transcription factor [Anaerolineales bacterium]